MCDKDAWEREAACARDARERLRATKLIYKWVTKLCVTQMCKRERERKRETLRAKESRGA